MVLANPIYRNACVLAHTRVLNKGQQAFGCFCVLRSTSVVFAYYNQITLMNSAVNK